MSDVVIGCRISDFGNILGTSSKFWTSWRITNICPIHTQLMQNYINIFRTGIITLIFCIHLLSHCKNFSIAPTLMTSQHNGFFSKCRPTYRENMSADIFQNAISNEGGDVVAERA